MEHEDRQHGALPDPLPRWGRGRVASLRKAPICKAPRYPRIESEQDAPTRAGEARDDARRAGEGPNAA